MALKYIPAQDPEVAAAIDAELARQRGTIELIASENFVSPAVLEAAGTVLTNKYAEGLPGKRYYGGCEKVDIVENIARDRVCELFGADHANVLDPEFAKLAREHNDANVVTLSARFVPVQTNEAILDAFLGTPFGGARHAGRVAKITAAEG